jgi:hypothetical protein
MQLSISVEPLLRAEALCLTYNVAI